MTSDEQRDALSVADEQFQWRWVAAGVLLGAALIAVFLYLVNPGLEEPAAAGFVGGLCLVLLGILVGYRSTGETIRETAVAGLLVAVLVGIAASLLLEVRVPVLVWLMGPFVAVLVSMMGGYAGEMLQGTLEEAYEDRAVDWPWVFVSVVIGITVSSYVVLVGEARLGFSPTASLGSFAASFLVTGWVVGRFSPGRTMVEPAIAAAFMLVVDAAFVILWLGDLSGSAIFLGFGAAVVLALLGGWLGEAHQSWAELRPAGKQGRSSVP